MEDLMTEIDKLRKVAQGHEASQAEAVAAGAKAAAQLEALTKKLSDEFGTASWDEAAGLLEPMRLKAQRGLQDVVEAFQKAGIDVG